MNLKGLLLKSRRLIIVATHLALVICTYILTFYLRFDFKIDSSHWQVIFKTLPILACIKMAILGYFGLYSGLWRYASIDNCFFMFKGNTFMQRISAILTFAMLFMCMIFTGSRAAWIAGPMSILFVSFLIDKKHLKYFISGFLIYL